MGKPSDNRLRATADPRTVQWIAVCRDCDGQSKPASERAAAIFWRLKHVLHRQTWEHRVGLVMSFKLPGGRKGFEVVES
jgi:hypothetical protein